MGNPSYVNGFELTIHEGMLEVPLHWKKPRRIFTCSMSDLFHEFVPIDLIQSVFTTMGRADWHQFQILTKRSMPLLALDPVLPWRPNMWMGVSVENEAYTFRIDQLRDTHAELKFLSLEPLLGPLPNLDLRDIDWAIVGGESGPGARPMHPDWVRDIRDQCLAAGVRLFFKQWGGVRKWETGRELDGRTWDEMPRTSAVNESASSPLPAAVDQR